MAGASQAVSGSCGWAATPKPKVDGSMSVISENVAPPSVDRKTPLWCWHHTTSGALAHRASRCGSCTTGFSAWSGGMNPARMPVDTVHEAPSSSVRQVPPQEMPTSTTSAERGSTQTECRPGWSKPPPIHWARLGSSQRARTSSHVVPRSDDRNSPPGMVPAQRAPGRWGWAASSDQIICVVHGTSSRRLGSTSTVPSGCGG
jgi:hypothetical protein